MDSIQLLKSWGVNTSSSDYIPEYLLKTNPDSCYFIDSLPFVVPKQYASKFDQIENEFKMQFSKKYNNIIKKLWLYNDTFLESEMLVQKHIQNKILNINKNSKLCFDNIFLNSNQPNLIYIQRLDDLQLLLQLCNDDLIDASIFFEQYQLMLVPSWSCYFVYMNDTTKLKLLEKIVNVEGLYLRK